MINRIEMMFTTEDTVDTGFQSLLPRDLTSASPVSSVVICFATVEMFPRAY